MHSANPPLQLLRSHRTSPRGKRFPSATDCLVLCVLLAILPRSATASSRIAVSTDIPSGNAANVRVTDEAATTTVRFTPHPHGGPECLWFCFRMKHLETAGKENALNDSSPAQELLKVVLECPGNTLGGGQLAHFRPVFRLANQDWQRAEAPKIIQLADGRREAAWSFRMPADFMDIALSYPYDREHLDKLIEETAGFWRADTIGVSQGGRPILRLSNDYGARNGKRPGFYLLARQHSGEVSGSWVLDGVLRRFAEMGKEAPMVWVAPLANIDGVEQGDYGKDNFPYDLNRAWGSPPMRHEVLVLQRDMRLFAGRCRFSGGVDFHSPGGTEAAGMYAFISKSIQAPEVSSTSTNLAAAIGEAMGGEFAAKNFVRTADYKSRWETPRFGNFCQDELNAPGISIETPYALIEGRALTREDYQQAGRRIADVLAAFPETPATR